MVNDDLIPLSDLKIKVKQFIDNNGSATCDYFHGKKSQNLSDHPQKAVISLQSDRNTNYEYFVLVQDELTKAYQELREKYALDILNKKTDDLTESDLRDIKAAYPFKISEVVVK